MWIACPFIAPLGTVPSRMLTIALLLVHYGFTHQNEVKKTLNSKTLLGQGTQLTFKVLFEENLRLTFPLPIRCTQPKTPLNSAMVSIPDTVSDKTIPFTTFKSATPSKIL